MALHGRQDNAGSFDTLIPLLSNEISVLCLDMPGHGLSSHYPKSQYYYVYWDGIILLRRIVKYFKWTKVSEWIQFYHSIYNLNKCCYITYNTTNLVLLLLYIDVTVSLEAIYYLTIILALHKIDLRY